MEVKRFEDVPEDMKELFIRDYESYCRFGHEEMTFDEWLVAHGFDELTKICKI